MIFMTIPATTGKYVSGEFFYNIKRNALRRGIYFDLSLEYLDHLIESQDFKCVYTGAPLDAKTRRNYTASLDRIDSAGGYEEGNVQFVLIQCNIMKWKMSNEDFLQLVSDIYKHRCGDDYVEL